MSDSEALVEKRRGRPSKDKSDVIILLYLIKCFYFNLILNMYYNLQLGCRERTQETCT